MDLAHTFSDPATAWMINARIPAVALDAFQGPSMPSRGQITKMDDLQIGLYTIVIT